MDLKAIFGEEALTLAQFQEKTKDMKLVDLSGGEYVAKGKYDGDIKKVKDELVEAKKTITTLEANKGDTAALEAVIPGISLPLLQSLSVSGQDYGGR